MQIHEITKHHLTEAPNLGGLAASAASGAVGSAISNSLMNKAFAGTGYVNPNTATSVPGGQAGAWKATAGIVAALVPATQKAWQTIVANKLAISKDPTTGAPATSVEQLDEPTKNQLRQQLTQLINNSIKPGQNFDYNTMGNNSGDRQIAGSADKIKTAITTNAEQILNLTLKGVKPADMTKNWEVLVSQGIAPAANFVAYNAQQEDADLKFDTKTQKMMIKFPNGPFVPFRSQDPKHAQVAKAWGYTPQQAESKI